MAGLARDGHNLIRGSEPPFQAVLLCLRIIGRTRGWAPLSDLVGLGWGLRTRMSNRVSGAADAAGWRPHSENHCCEVGVLLC